MAVTLPPSRNCDEVFTLQVGVMAGVRSLPRRASRGKKPNFGVCNIVRDPKDVTIYDESLERMVEQAMKRSITS